MVTGQMTAQEIFVKYKDDMLKLIAYLPWLEQTSGKSKVSGLYESDDPNKKFMPFPVFDGNLMRFVKDAESTGLVDRNYVYVITRHQLRTPQQEIDFVSACDIRRLSDIGAVLSKYVLEGKVRATIWPEAMDKGVFLTVVKRLSDIYSECLQWE